ncbi:hypothetical protein HaLaN_01720 [Haematococcus lacustris]|uniref:Uncharacterized protein n=1 Tax=Haematococcus lacustris TaxID=44745 RepID=A0A699YLS8_HAELA|nr:hypothetical protein HaLaN_01720 [Haematococcus lacustris]
MPVAPEQPRAAKIGQNDVGNELINFQPADPGKGAHQPEQPANFALMNCCKILKDRCMRSRLSLADHSATWPPPTHLNPPSPNLVYPAQLPVAPHPSLPSASSPLTLPLLASYISPTSPSPISVSITPHHPDHRAKPRTKKRLSKAKSAQLYALNKSPRAGYLHCPNNIKAAACTAQATNRDLQAEVQRLRDVEQSLMGTVDGLQGDLDDLLAAHQRLQGEHTVTPAIGCTPDKLRPVFKSFTAIFAQGGTAHQSEASGLLGLMCTCAGAGGGAERLGRAVLGIAYLVGL